MVNESLYMSAEMKEAPKMLCLRAYYKKELDCSTAKATYSGFC